MTRWALRLEYDGRGFVGWQRQTNGLSVQEALEVAAARMCGGTMPRVIAAGRTDSGVHARGQVVMIDLPERYGSRAVADALNFHLKPHAVAVTAVGAVPDQDWSPRFSAVERQYRYVILNRIAQPAIEAGFVWHVRRALDAEAMQEAARFLIGLHDFTTFRATSCQAASPVRTIDRLDIRRLDDHLIIDVSARSFLHHQVRNMVGTLKLVGEGRWPGTRVGEALAARDRAAGGPTAPPNGLSLMTVRYERDPFATTP